MAPSNWHASRFSFASILALILWAAVGCGAGNGRTAMPPQVSVTITPVTATVPVGTLQPFSGFAVGTTSSIVTWTTSAGSIDQSGNYTAPTSMPAGGTARVTATSVNTPSASASATVTITTQPVTLSLSPPSATVKAGFSNTYTATVGGTTNGSITWSVNDLPGDTSYPGSIAGGLYTAPAPVLAAHAYSIVAVSNADPTKSASASVTVTPLENQEQQTFPIKLGSSGINANSNDCCSGTLGSLLADQKGTQYILSNNHILGRVGHAVAGEAIVQPGYVDAQCNFTLPNTVAHFTAATPIPGSNVDAAIAEVVAGAVDPQGEIIGLGGIASDGSYIPAPPANTTAVATVGMGVTKSGRTTGLSCGSVQGINGDILIDLPAECGNPVDRTVEFRNQVVMFHIGQHGDSGSLVVESATSRPLALVAGVSNDGQYTTANPITDVLAALDSTTGLKLNFVGAGQHEVSCSAPAAPLAQSSNPQTRALPDMIPAHEISRAVLVKNKYKHAIMNDQAVIGLAVGRSEVNYGRAAILVFVERTKKLSFPLPAVLDDIETQVVYAGRFQAGAMPSVTPKQCSSRAIGMPRR